MNQARTDRLAVTAELVAATRRLMVAAATSDVDLRELAQAAEAMDALSAQLLDTHRDHPIREHLDRAAIARVREGEPWRLFDHNPQAVPLAVRVDGTRASAEVATTVLMEGPPRLMHGGISGQILDSLLSTLAQAQGRRVVTARLELSFAAAITLDDSVLVRGEITRIEGRKMFATGELVSGSQVAVRAEALFIEIPGEPD